MTSPEATRKLAITHLNPWDGAMREILEVLRVGVVLVDESLKVRMVNRAMERMALACGVDFRSNSPLGQAFSEALPGDFFQGCLTHLRRAIQEGERYVSPGAERVDEDGGLLLRVSFGPFDLVQGRCGGGWGLFEDASSEEILIEKMENCAAQLEHLWTSTCDAMIVTDSCGRIVDYNMAAEEILGFFKEEVLGHPFSSLLDKKKDGVAMTDLIQQGKYIANHVTSFKTKHRVIIPISLTIASLPGKGGEKSGGAIVIARDMTHHKRVVDELEETSLALTTATAEVKNLRAGLHGGVLEMIKVADRGLYDLVIETKRVARAIALSMGLDDDTISLIEDAAALSEIGGIAGHGEAAPHAVKSSAILKAFRIPAPLQEAIQHHEDRYDGHGKPDGLSGDHIPLPSRILSVAEEFVRHMQRTSGDLGKTFAHLHRQAGHRLDPAVVQCLVELYEMEDML